jgi:signal transduction histidine kinase
MASHELRTPLTPILGFLDILSDHGDPLSEAQTGIIDVVRRNAQRMLSLVEDLLVAGRAVTGPLDALPSDVALTDIVDRVVDELGPTIPTVDRTVEGWHLRVDLTHLHQVLGNLLTNATKYGAPPISITASSNEPGRVIVEVTDHGPGVPEEFVPRMWDRFSQGDRGDSRSSRGVGLGLAIVRLLVEADGGRIGYRAGVPTGAVFRLDLPGYYAGGADGADTFPAATAAGLDPEAS